MKNEELVTLFVVFVSLVFLFLWFKSSVPMLQVGGALYGVPGTDPISPLMAVLIVIWFMLVSVVVFLNRPKH